MTILGPTFALEALQYGWDSLFAGAVLGFAISRWRGRLAMAVLFGVCDGGATLLGDVVSHRAIDMPDAAPFIFLFIVLALAIRGRRNWLWMSPLLFSVDNFFSMAPPGDVPWLTCSSAFLAWTGLSLSGLLMRTGRALYLSRSCDVNADRKAERA
ncbi:hypothetical protein ACFQ3P_04610 [Paraburkholderia sabiae]|uniref:DUF2878 domain-containing protein n=1 Tax=Paraburkholderia sabiae TaxID=273251 RepID=A0ABU9QMH9_9BURK|nr:hypothetical protein [Paraburkholderia sabiae]WJZ79145.1 hypothetical protein QEN71_34815 [Paraburkholderia sabiae]CAD6514450.1 hypothetical protein LMG24235_00922 [Paraburkholderia sabiae]